MKAFVTCVRDYHDFGLIKQALSHAGYDMEYKEIGCGHSELTGNSAYGLYHAIFFMKNEVITSIMNEWEDKIWHN